MNIEIKNAILDKIKEYDKILIFRHIRPDGDCMGASKGLREILRLSYPCKEIYIVDNQHSDYLAFLGEDDSEVPDEFYSHSLGIVVDTANKDRISNQKFSLCREIIKIDHHIEISPFGDISWVEEQRSSACEMIADFYNTFKDELKINKTAAQYIYTGMVTDSGRFRFRSVSGETLRLAALMLDAGVDTDTLYANLYLEDYDSYKFKAYIYSNVERTENGAAYLYISREMQEKFHLSFEDASATVNSMDSIKGYLCWLAFIENPDSEDEIRVRLRSRFMSINHLAEEYNGGGHAQACGATIHSKNQLKEMIEKADAMVKNYKENNEGWM